jgi:hypothetical protein
MPLICSPSKLCGAVRPGQGPALAVGVVLLLARPCWVLAQQSPTVPPQPTAPGYGVVLPQPSPQPAATDPAPAAAEEAKDTESLYKLVTDIVLDNLPEEYEDTKHWGTTKEIWRGVRFSGKPLEMKMNSRKKQVNHGTWRLYRITLVDPENRFQARIVDARITGSGRVAFDAIVTARLNCYGRLAQWERGVQLISLSIDAVADVQLRLSCEVGVRPDFGQILPAIVVDPRVTDANLVLTDFRVHRISKLEGHFAHQLGKNLRGVLVGKIENKRQKMVERINSRIDQKRDKLRFSLAGLGKKAWEEFRDMSRSNEAPDSETVGANE